MESDSFFLQALQAMSEAVVILDSHGCVVFLNNAATSFLGVSLSESIGQIFSSHFILENVELVSSSFAYGDKKYLLMQLKRVPESLPLSRMESADEARVIESEHLASIGVLASGVVHEINNPLTIINVAAEMIAADLPSGAVSTGTHEHLLRIMHSAKRIVRIVNSLRSYLHADMGTVEPLHLHSMIRENLGFFQIICEKEGVQFSVTLAALDDCIVGVSGRFQLAFITLLSNLHAALESREDAKIVIETRNHEGAIECLLSDNSLEGTPCCAFGLSLASGLIAGMGGGLRVQQSPAKGNFFSITLPLMLHT